MPRRSLPLLRSWLVVLAIAGVAYLIVDEPWSVDARQAFPHGARRASPQLVASPDAESDQLVGVAHVIDGDTIRVGTERVRLGGIDAPERDQPYGRGSSNQLAQMVEDEEVRVDWYKRDRYGRLIGTVWVQPVDCPRCGKTLDAGLAQVTMGAAWWFRRYANEQSPEDRERYEHAEDDARARRLGLWADPEPVPPWEWRRR